MAPAPDPDFIDSITSTTATTQHLARRDLTVNHTQAVTVGIIGVYVVVIALLWNIPYVRNVLWPFKVRSFHFLFNV